MAYRRRADERVEIGFGGFCAIREPSFATLAVAGNPRWQLVDDARRIERNFRFDNFREALSFVQKVGELAEAEGHHPNISFGWGNATISLQTKKIKGLHENDFIMAAKIDRIFARAASASGS
jgi:4a-hydroxytetrahydrobiopterin dehydratase